MGGFSPRGDFVLEPSLLIQTSSLCLGHLRKLFEFNGLLLLWCMNEIRVLSSSAIKSSSIRSTDSLASASLFLLASGWALSCLN